MVKQAGFGIGWFPFVAGAFSVKTRVMRADRHGGWVLVALWAMLLAVLPAGAQTDRFRVMAYNVENLFDCKRDSLKDDSEFQPDASRRWTYGRYRDKLAKLSRVIAAADGGEQAPDLVALCEVENERVLTDLTRGAPLKELGYRYLMTDSPDERGIDVALLYQPGRFRVVEHRALRIPRMEGHRPTRDILHVAGRMATGDTLDVFVCHFPSRASGVRHSRPYRIHAAGVLKHHCDSLMAVRREPRIVVAGDFNDVPEGSLLRDVLGAGKPDDNIAPHRLYNLMAGKKPGTYRYRGEWSVFDHILVSGLLLDARAGIHTSCDDAAVVAYPFLLERDVKYGGFKPFRTYVGPRYVGGYSDHLPVRADFYPD